MAKGFDVLHVKSAVKNRNKFDLSRTHLTTMDFGQIVPLFTEETVPGDQISVNAEYFSRMAPLVKPTYGKFSFRTASFFVPYHQIADDADAWLAGKLTWEGDTTHHRYFTVLSLCQIAAFGQDSGVAGTAANCDFSYIDDSGSTQYVYFAPEYRWVFKVLNSLGYALPQNCDMQTGSTFMTSEAYYKLSAYPLLAFLKAYNDYMSQSQRYNNSELSTFLRKVKHCVSLENLFDGSTGELTTVGVLQPLFHVLLNYENDYFTSAWQYPNMPLLESSRNAWLGVPASDNEQVNLQTAYNELESSNTDGSKFTLSQRALDFLRSFDDWVRRNNYSGSRAVQQVYSRFGIKTDDYRSNYAHVLSTDVLPIQVGDVTATAEGTNVPLGDYAGKGIMSGSKGVTCKANDYGLFLILGYFTVAPMNAYGFDRKVLRNSPTDYYTPEFDGIGAEAISAGEFFASPIVVGDGTSDMDVFGYTERYNSYRYGRDLITGDFRNFHASADDNTWHTGRLLTDVRSDGHLVAQSSDVNTMSQIDSEYNRIFATNTDGVDHFYLTCRFNVSAIRPMMNLNQVVKLGEGDTTLPRNGNVIN